MCVTLLTTGQRAALCFHVPKLCCHVNELKLATQTTSFAQSCTLNSKYFVWDITGHKARGIRAGVLNVITVEIRTWFHSPHPERPSSTHVTDLRGSHCWRTFLPHLLRSSGIDLHHSELLLQGKVQCQIQAHFLEFREWKRQNKCYVMHMTVTQLRPQRGRAGDCLRDVFQGTCVLSSESPWVSHGFLDLTGKQRWNVTDDHRWGTKMNHC